MSSQVINSYRFAPSFVPTDISDLIAWYDATDESTITKSNLSNDNTVTDQTSGSTSWRSSPSNSSIIGTKILSGNSLIGLSCSSLTFSLKRGGSTSGNVEIGRVPITTTDGSFETSTTADVSGIGTGSFSDITYTYDFGTIAENDVLGIIKQKEKDNE